MQEMTHSRDGSGELAEAPRSAFRSIIIEFPHARPGLTAAELTWGIAALEYIYDEAVYEFYPEGIIGDLAPFSYPRHRLRTRPELALRVGQIRYGSPFGIELLLPLFTGTAMFVTGTAKTLAKAASDISKSIADYYIAKVQADSNVAVVKVQEEGKTERLRMKLEFDREMSQRIPLEVNPQVLPRPSSGASKGGDRVPDDTKPLRAANRELSGEPKSVSLVQARPEPSRTAEAALRSVFGG